jgi:hypothetical protein
MVLRWSLATVGPLAPRDERVDVAAEVALVHIVEERKQVVMLALRNEGRVALATGQTDPVFVDVVAECSARISVTSCHIANQGIDHRSRGIQEHVVDPDVKRAPLDPVGDDRMAIVGDRQHHWPGEGRPKLALEGLSRPLVDEQSWRRCRKDQPELGLCPFGNSYRRRYLRPGESRCPRGANAARVQQG